jgi:ArsR family transcriptional regulator
MNELVQTAKAFADPTRVRILFTLKGGELCVCELCDALDITQSTLSTHLKIIRQSGLTQTRRAGKWTYYALAPSAKDIAAFLFESFATPLHADRQLRKDSRRLQQRLAKRQDGACCVGFSAKGCA